MLHWVGKKPLDKIEYYPAQEKEIYGDKNSKDFNKLFWGEAPNPVYYAKTV